MKIEEEARSCELLRRSSSLLKSRLTEKEAATMSTEEREGVKTGL
jgi:hypothetical protein